MQTVVDDSFLFGRNALFSHDGFKERHPEQVSVKPRKVTFKADRLDDYFNDEYTEEKITEVIISLLDEWKKRGEKA